MDKPVIILDFSQSVVHWHSCGWGNDPALMRKAQQAIRKGDTPAEVVELLKADFAVSLWKSTQKMV